MLLLLLLLPLGVDGILSGGDADTAEASTIILPDQDDGDIDPSIIVMKKQRIVIAIFVTIKRSEIVGLRENILFLTITQE